METTNPYAPHQVSTSVIPQGAYTMPISSVYNLNSLQQAGIDPTFVADNYGTTYTDNSGISYLVNFSDLPAPGQTFDNPNYSPAPTVDYSGRRSAVNNAFDTKISGLRDLLGAAPQQENTQRSMVQNMYGSNFNSLQSARDLGLNQIGAAREGVEQRSGRDLRNLAETGRNALRAFNSQLGTFGAGDSSAAMLGAGAIGKQQAQLKSDYLGGVQDNYTQLDLAQQGVQSDFDVAVQELTTWRDNNILQIAQTYDDLIMQIKQEMSTADSQRQLALAELAADFSSEAAASIQNVQDQFNQASGRQIQGPQVRDIQNPNYNLQDASQVIVQGSQGMGNIMSGQFGGSLNATSGNPGLSNLTVRRRDEKRSPLNVGISTAGNNPLNVRR